MSLKNNGGRVKTGIKGFDELIKGGFPNTGTYLVTGTSGTGKTLFGIEFVYKGITMFDEPGVFITMDEPPDKLRAHVKMSFGWDLEKLENEGKLAIVDAISSRVSAPSNEKYILRRGEIDSLLYKTANIIGEIGAKRVVLDSIVSLAYQYDSIFDLRRDIQRLCYGISQLNCTFLITTEVPSGSDRLSRFDIEEFVVDGIILLKLEKESDVNLRRLMIVKMRGTDHDMKEHTFNITREGLVVD
ncbi:MAG: ATPase domain-containing protein [Candidatus Odinarchaeota archaeon]